MSATRADRTAIRRTSLSRPAALALQDNLIHPERTFFDYGCGRGDDLLRLQKLGIVVSGWDPAFFPDEERSPADVVNLGYVVNVIEDPHDRMVVLAAAWALTRQVLIVSARLDWEATDAAVDFQGDGIVTGRRTFQKFFTQEELRTWIERVLRRRPVAAAPGIFYVFRNADDEQCFAAARVSTPRRPLATDRAHGFVARHHELIHLLMDFVSERGRLPAPGELPAARELTRTFGSVARAFSLLRRITGPDRWDRVRRERRADAIVYLALATFPKRPRFGALPEELRYDVRAFFGSYRSGGLGDRGRERVGLDQVSQVGGGLLVHLVDPPTTRRDSSSMCRGWSRHRSVPALSLILILLSPIESAAATPTRPCDKPPRRLRRSSPVDDGAGLRPDRAAPAACRRRRMAMMDRFFACPQKRLA